MERGALLYQGKSKRVYATEDPRRVVLEFTDEATAFNAKKRATVPDKGRINCAISAHLFGLVDAVGVPHHMVEVLDDTKVLCEHVEVVPVEVVVRNIVAGSFAKRYGLKEGDPLSAPLVEWFYKSDALDDPLVGHDAIVELGWARPWELAFMHEAALKINEVLQRFWGALDIDLVDAKYEFGRQGGRLILADEITPDGCRLWERGTARHLDKDVFRRDLGDLGDTYRELHDRVFGR